MESKLVICLGINGGYDICRVVGEGRDQTFERVAYRNHHAEAMSLLRIMKQAEEEGDGLDRVFAEVE